MLPLIFWSEFQLVKYFLKNYAAISFCLLEKLRRCHQNSSKTQMTVEFLWNSSRILIRILVGNLSGKYISWSLSISIKIPLVNCFWRIVMSFVFAYRKSCRGEDFIRILKKIRWQQNSSRILIRILVGNFSGKYIRLKNSSRILVGNAAAADCRIPMEFWLEFQLILNGAKSADCV